jgi:hypothetical protein
LLHKKRQFFQGFRRAVKDIRAVRQRHSACVARNSQVVYALPSFYWVLLSPGKRNRGGG